MKFVGKVWKFGDDINTDLMFPMGAFEVPQVERKMLVFQANRPGWSELVNPGDVIVGGRNYGLGSGRSAPESLRDLGIAALVAESINGLFLRNCINHGFPVLQCPGVHAAFAEGDKAEVELRAGTVRNLRTGTVLQGMKLPDILLEIIEAGGVLAGLRAEGFID